MKNFKSKIWIGILALMIFLVGFSVCAGAASAACNVVIDELEVVFDADSGAPFIDGNNRTLVPLRKTMEMYGCEVDWDQATRTASVKMDGTTVLVGIGNSYITVDGEKVAIDTAAQIVNNRTYLPIRAVLEAFGAHVDWINSTRTVEVKSPEYVSGQPRVFALAAEVNLEEFCSVEVPIGITAPGGELSGGLTYTFGDGSVARGQFIDVDYGAKILISAYGPGSTTVRISFTDPKYTDSATIKINVSKPAKEMQAYAEHPSVPNIGEYFGLKLVRADEDEVVKLYEYDLSTYNEAKYGQNAFIVSDRILQSKGFEQYDTQENAYGVVVGIYYRNNRTGEKLLMAESQLTNGNHSLVIAVFK